MRFEKQHHMGGIQKMREKKIRVAVIDGQGGGMGRAITQRIKAEFPQVAIRALGTNAMATAAMLKGGCR